MWSRSVAGADPYILRSMFCLTDSLQYYFCSGSTDMRKGFDTLCGVVRSRMGRDPLSGEVFIFLNRSRTTIKLLHWERGGLVIYSKRLESGCFEGPSRDDKQNSYYMKWSELVLMTEGLSAKSFVQRKRYVHSDG